MDAVNVKINGLVFDRANCDAHGDVLYLARGDSAEASDPTPRSLTHAGSLNAIGT